MGSEGAGGKMVQSGRRQKRRDMWRAIGRAGGDVVGEAMAVLVWWAVMRRIVKSMARW